jgi:hypothetical protein
VGARGRYLWLERRAVTPARIDARLQVAEDWMRRHRYGIVAAGSFGTRFIIRRIAGGNAQPHTTSEEVPASG